MAARTVPPTKNKPSKAKPLNAKAGEAKRALPVKPKTRATQLKKPGVELNNARENIDSIDAQIQNLIAQRAQLAQQVGKAKGKLKSAVDYYRPEREAQVLQQVLGRNHGPLNDEVLIRLFREIMSACLAQQQPLRVGYLGPEGTFSQQAMLKHFGHSATGFALASIEEVFQEVEDGNADFGVVPVENSGQGTIQSTLDTFLSSTVKICGEIELRVHQHLLSRSGTLDGIERVYSHAQSLAQCKGWLRQNLPHAEKIAVSSNAEAARRARTADDAAAIAGQSAAHVYGLKVAAGPLEDRPDNTTRFLVLGRELFPPCGHDRTSLLVFVNDTPGALYHVLSPFAKYGVSMNRIESRPAHTGKWQYAFFIDVSGHVHDEKVGQALSELGEYAAMVKVLGSYPVALM